jgi:sulfatase modifying factor 1
VRAGSYCHRYRVAARSADTAESASADIGFRCANDA